MRVPEIVRVMTAGALFGVSVLFAGLLMAPFWLLVVIIGVLLGAIEVREAPRKFWELITCQWLLD